MGKDNSIMKFKRGDRVRVRPDRFYSNKKEGTILCLDSVKHGWDDYKVQWDDYTINYFFGDSLELIIPKPSMIINVDELFEELDI